MDADCQIFCIKRQYLSSSFASVASLSIRGFSSCPGDCILPVMPVGKEDATKIARNAGIRKTERARGLEGSTAITAAPTL